VKGRVERLTELLPEVEIDVLLVTNLVNVRYLTGYDGSNGIALVGPRTRAFATDFRYVEQAAEQVHPSFARARAALDLLEAVADLLPAGEVRLGFDDAHMPVRQHARLLDLLPRRVELVGAGGLVERIRAAKEPDEVALIRTAAQLADAAFERIIRDGLIGRTEREVAIALEHDMRERGARRPSFDSIIAAGAHGALPHAQPRDVPIRAGELVVIDWGAELDGYCSDCTRTYVAGGSPPDDFAAYLTGDDFVVSISADPDGAAIWYYDVIDGPAVKVYALGFLLFQKRNPVRAADAAYPERHDQVRYQLQWVISVVANYGTDVLSGRREWFSEYVWDVSDVIGDLRNRILTAISLRKMHADHVRAVAATSAT